MRHGHATSDAGVTLEGRHSTRLDVGGQSPESACCVGLTQPHVLMHMSTFLSAKNDCSYER